MLLTCDHSFHKHQSQVLLAPQGGAFQNCIMSCQGEAIILHHSANVGSILLCKVAGIAHKDEI